MRGKAEDGLAKDIKSKAHKLAGSAAIFGFDYLGDLAAQLEKYLNDIEKGNKSSGQEDILKQLLEQIVGEMMQIVKSFKEEDSFLLTAEGLPKSYNVLVVDDDEAIQKLLIAGLSEISCKMVCASSGNEALKIVKKKIPDLIILDVDMPGLNGIDTLTALKSEDKTKGIPIIMLTHNNEDKTMISGISQGVQDYVTKPFNLSKFLEHVKRILLRNKTKIFIADDDEVIVDLLYQRFYRMGYKVITVTNGKEALASIKKELPHLAILDVMMPAMDGFSILEQIRSDPKIADMPVIFLTAKSQHDNIIHGLEEGANDYIAKPFDIDEVASRVSGVLQRSQKS